MTRRRGGGDRLRAGPVRDRVSRAAPANGPAGPGYPSASAPEHNDPVEAEDAAEDDVPF